MVKGTFYLPLRWNLLINLLYYWSIVIGNNPVKVFYLFYYLSDFFMLRIIIVIHIYNSLKIVFFS